MISIKTTRELIAHNIIYFRHQAKWSQEKLAEKMQSSPAYVSQLENAKRNVTSDFLDKIAYTFNIEPFELLKDRAIIKCKRINQKK